MKGRVASAMLTLIRDGGLTPHQLVELHKDGAFVGRSAHIGNQCLSNMALASIGIPLYLYDRTVFSKDRNYHPHLRILGGKGERLTDFQDTVVPYGFFELTAVTDPGTPASFHCDTLESLFPGVVRTDSELLLGHLGMIQALFERAESCAVSAFDRYVFPCGCMEKLRPRAEDTWSHRASYSVNAYVRCRHEGSRELKKIKFAEEAASLIGELAHLVDTPRLTFRRGGAVPSMPFVVVIGALVGFWQSGRTTVYELSGPDMVKYALSPEFTSRVSELWERLSRVSSGKLVLPAELTLKLVPTSDFRFVYLESDGGSRKAVEGYLEILSAQEVKRQLKRNGGGVDQRAFAEANRRVEAAREAVAGSDWNIFYDIHEGTFFSHHDLLESGSRLVIPSRALQMSFDEMTRAVELLKVVLRRNRNPAQAWGGAE